MKLFKKKNTMQTAKSHTSLRPAMLKLKKLYGNTRKVYGCFSNDASSPESYAENITERAAKTAALKTLRLSKLTALRRDNLRISHTSYASNNPPDPGSLKNKKRFYSDDSGCKKSFSSDSSYKPPSVSCRYYAHDTHLRSENHAESCADRASFPLRKNDLNHKKHLKKKEKDNCISTFKSSDTNLPSQSLKAVYASSENIPTGFKVKSLAAKKRSSNLAAVLSLDSPVKKNVIKSGAFIMAAVAFILTVLVFFAAISEVFVSPYAVMYASSGTFNISEKIIELNLSYQAKIDEILISSSADETVITGSKAVWTDMLSLYAASYLYCPSENDLDPSLYLEKIFYDMNHITCVETTVPCRKTVPVTDDDGIVTYEIEEDEKTVLTITLSHLSVESMAEQYSFSDDQRRILYELRHGRYSSMWTDIIHSSGIENDMVSVALSQLGNINGEVFWSWYGYDTRVPWCAIFISWCAYVCGYIDSGACPKFENCQCGITYFAENEAFKSRDYTPCRGDIIFFDWESDGVSDHVGLVESVEDGNIFTVEGNSNNTCARRSYPLFCEKIAGYGIVEFKQG